MKNGKIVNGGVRVSCCRDIEAIYDLRRRHSGIDLEPVTFHVLLPILVLDNVVNVVYPTTLQSELCKSRELLLSVLDSEAP